MMKDLIRNFVQINRIVCNSAEKIHFDMEPSVFPLLQKAVECKIHLRMN